MALVLLAASAVMAFGIWRRRPDLGGSAFLIVVLSGWLLLTAGQWATLHWFRTGLRTEFMRLLVLNALAYAVAGLPLYIALRWAITIDQATEAPEAPQ